MNTSNNTLGKDHKDQWLSLIPEQYRIKRVSAEEFFSKHYATKEPCIIESVNWDCTKWTPETLAEKLGQYEHSFSYEEGKSLQMPIKEYISRVFMENDANSRQIPNLPTPPSSTEKVPYARHIGPLTDQMYSDVQIEQLFPQDKLKGIRMRKFLFLGAASTKTNNHYDWSHNFVYCVQGIKHVTLLPPKSEAHMTNITEELRAQLGRGDCFFVPEPEAFELDLCHPKNGNEEGKVAMHQHPVLHKCPGLIYSPLFPGDVVFFPAYWYHYFHNVTSTVSVTIQTYC